MSQLNSTTGQSHQLEIVANTVRNPLTGRTITTTGRAFQQLVNKNILKLSPDDNSKVIFYGDDPSTAIKVKQSLDVVEDTLHQLKLDGKGKIRKTRRIVSRTELSKKIQDVSIEVYKENIHLFNDSMPSEQVSSILENLIKQRMIDPKPKSKTMQKNIEYIIENVDQYGSDDNYSSCSDITEEDDDENSE
jgi:hypothetical protein